MYTMTALSTDPYVGIFVALGLLVFVMTALAAHLEYWTFGEWIVKFSLWMSVAMGIGWVVFDKPIPPKNELVVVELMDDSWHLREKSGKRYVENGYLMYMTPDGPVSFKRNTGQVYPQKATLYKN